MHGKNLMTVKVEFEQVQKQKLCICCTVFYVTYMSLSVRCNLTCKYNTFVRTINVSTKYLK